MGDEDRDQMECDHCEKEHKYGADGTCHRTADKVLRQLQVIASISFNAHTD